MPRLHAPPLGLVYWNFPSVYDAIGSLSKQLKNIDRIIAVPRLGREAVGWLGIPPAFPPATLATTFFDHADNSKKEARRKIHFGCANQCVSM